MEENTFENVVWEMVAICLGLNVLMNVCHSKCEQKLPKIKFHQGQPKNLSTLDEY